MQPFVIITAVLLTCEILILACLKHLHIGDKMTKRSSHKQFTPTAGGIIYPIAAIMVFRLFDQQMPEPMPLMVMLIGSLILALVSLIDDFHSLPAINRLIIQVIVVGITFMPLFQPDISHIYLLVLILSVGFINAYNFMDGINGMLCAYSIVTLSSLLWVMHVSPIEISMFVDWMPILKQLTKALIITTIIFGIFNFRKKAKIFCGDVGSVTLGFYIAFILASVVLATFNAEWIVFVIVYAIDTVFTIFQRLFAGENILQSHRKHLYQLLANEKHISQPIVSLSYATIQAVVNIGLLCIPSQLRWSYIIIVLVILSTIYFILKGRIKTDK